VPRGGVKREQEQKQNGNTDRGRTGWRAWEVTNLLADLRYLLASSIASCPCPLRRCAREYTGGGIFGAVAAADADHPAPAAAPGWIPSPPPSPTSARPVMNASAWLVSSARSRRLPFSPCLTQSELRCPLLQRQQTRPATCLKPQQARRLSCSWASSPWSRSACISTSLRSQAWLARAGSSKTSRLTGR
jgi:hypothetical protein